MATRKANDPLVGLADHAAREPGRAAGVNDARYDHLVRVLAADLQLLQQRVVLSARSSSKHKAQRDQPSFPSNSPDSVTRPVLRSARFHHRHAAGRRHAGETLPVPPLPQPHPLDAVLGLSRTSAGTCLGSGIPVLSRNHLATCSSGVMLAGPVRPPGSPAPSTTLRRIRQDLEGPRHAVASHRRARQPATGMPWRYGRWRVRRAGGTRGLSEGRGAAGVVLRARRASRRNSLESGVTGYVVVAPVTAIRGAE